MIHHTPGSAPPPNAEWTDERVEQGVSNLLRIGVIVAAIVTVIGAAMYLIAHGTAPADYRTFQGTTTGLHTIREILTGAMALDSRAVIQLGLLLLIATPIARVALSLLGFIKQHDRMYIFVTTIVLAVLLLSLSGKQ